MCDAPGVWLTFPMAVFHTVTHGQINMHIQASKIRENEERARKFGSPTSDDANKTKQARITELHRPKYTHRFEIGVHVCVCT